MTEPFALDARLSLCARLVRRGAKIADIGTDHAYLPVWLCKTGVCPQALACDIRPEPLANGERTIAKYNAGKYVHTRLSDGLQNISAKEADDIIIAGMGGEMICKILSGCQWAKDEKKHFILQPMSKWEKLIPYLCKEGFEICSQHCCCSGQKMYTVLSARYTGASLPCGDIYPFLGELHPDTETSHRRFIEREIRRLQSKAKGDPQFFSIAEKLKKACDPS